MPLSYADNLMDLSTSSLLSGIVISCLGAGVFLYGKNVQRMPPLVIGLAMCLYPYFLSVLIMWIVTVILLGALYKLREV